ncbi:MAG: membrane integrity-associated transporter subunit PqiC [Alphaproteobacteria bacterium]|nr:membrane integrity-associated transporter subunit PqiC [Alphaproteobacteria bacterium]
MRQKIWTIGLCLLLGACFMGRSEPATFYTLTPVSEKQVSTEKFSIGVNRVHLARYLDRPQIIVRQSDQNEMLISENHRWVEPLATLIARTVAQDLKIAFPKAVVQMRTAALNPFDYVISLNVIQLDARFNGQAVLVAGWSIRNRSGDKIAEKQITLSAPVQGEYGSLVAVESDLISRLTEQIAQKIEDTRQY